MPHLSEAVGWRIGFWWEGTREWVDGEVLSYRASDARHLVVFADGEFEWMSLGLETIRWVGNTRERGNRLSPIPFGLDKETNPPKGREAVDWVVDVYDKNINQMQRVEISGFDSVTGKHRVVFSDSRKVAWISLTASKIVWRFPPGLPTPAADAATAGAELVETENADVVRPGPLRRTSPSVVGFVLPKAKGARHKRKGVPPAGTPEPNSLEGGSPTSPAALRASKKGACKGSSSCGKNAAAPKGSNLKSKSVPTVSPPASKAACKAAVAAPSPQTAAGTRKRPVDIVSAPMPPKKKACAAKDGPSTEHVITAAHPPGSDALSELACAQRRRRSGCPSNGQTMQHVSAPLTMPGSAVAVMGEPKVVQCTAHHETTASAPISNLRPACIRPVAALHHGIRDAAFVKCSLSQPQALVKSPGMFKNSVQCLLAATERRQQFVRALMKHLGDAVSAPLPSAALMTMPTDPRRAAKSQAVDDASKAVPVAAQAGAQTLVHHTPKQNQASAAEPLYHPPQRASALQVGPSGDSGKAAAVRLPVPAAPCHPMQQPLAAMARPAQTPTVCKPAIVSQFTPKFAPLSSLQRRHTVVGASPVTLPAVAPDSKAVQAMLKQRSSPDMANQSVTLSMSMVAKAVSAAAPPSVPQAARSPPSDQTSSSCKIDDVRCASLAKLGGARQQQAARVSSATWQVSQMQGVGGRQGVGGSQCDTHTESCNGGGRVQESSRTTSLNRTISSNVRTANLRWGGPPLVAARASIGLKGGGSGAGSAGGRACG